MLEKVGLLTFFDSYWSLFEFGFRKRFEKETL